MLDLALVDYNLRSYCSLIHLEPTYSVFVCSLLCYIYLVLIYNEADKHSIVLSVRGAADKHRAVSSLSSH